MNPSSKTITATTFAGNLRGNAETATKLATARTISLTGSVTGSGSFDGSDNLSIATTTNHNHDSLYPKKDGTGASGTWPISISGNAATASSVAWSNVSGKPSTFTPSSHTHSVS